MSKFRIAPSVFKALCASSVLACAAFGVSVNAQTFPTKPVTILIPAPAGGPLDVSARKIGIPLSKSLGQPVIVDNAPGGSGSIAAQKALNAPADGHTLFMASPNDVILAPLSIASVKYKSEDFRSVQRVALYPIAIKVRKDLPVNNLEELAAYVQKMSKEGKPVSYASTGNGSFYHLLGEDMAKRLNATMMHVPYKGSAPALQDLMGGQVDLMVAVYNATEIEMYKQGKIKFIAALSPKRHALLPDVPSVDESKSLKGFHHNISAGYFLPKKTPDDVVKKLNKALGDVLGDKDVKTALEAQGAIVTKPLSVEEAAKVFTDEVAQFRAIAKSINLQPQ